MSKLVFSNQRGGVGKTTSAIACAYYFAKQGKKVLLIDTDGQGSIAQSLGLTPKYFLQTLIVHKETLETCITPAPGGVDVICSNRGTHEAEAYLYGQMAREMALKVLLDPITTHYDAVLVDVSPSISVLQVCS